MNIFHANKIKINYTKFKFLRPKRKVEDADVGDNTRKFKLLKLVNSPCKIIANGNRKPKNNTSNLYLDDTHDQSTTMITHISKSHTYKKDIIGLLDNTIDGLQRLKTLILEDEGTSHCEGEGESSYFHKTKKMKRKIENPLMMNTNVNVNLKSSNRIFVPIHSKSRYKIERFRYQAVKGISQMKSKERNKRIERTYTIDETLPNFEFVD